jgi:hypothetical protein
MLTRHIRMALLTSLAAALSAPAWADGAAVEREATKGGQASTLIPQALPVASQVWLARQATAGRLSRTTSNRKSTGRYALSGARHSSYRPLPLILGIGY